MNISVKRLQPYIQFASWISFFMFLLLLSGVVVGPIAMTVIALLYMVSALFEAWNKEAVFRNTMELIEKFHGTDTKLKINALRISLVISILYGAVLISLITTLLGSVLVATGCFAIIYSRNYYITRIKEEL